MTPGFFQAVVVAMLIVKLLRRHIVAVRCRRVRCQYAKDGYIQRYPFAVHQRSPNNPTPMIDTAHPQIRSMLNVVEEYIMNSYRPGLYHMINTIVVILAAAVVIAGCAGTGSKKEDMTLATEQISIARSDVSNAISAGGNEFAPLQVKSAMEKIGSAEQAMTAKEYSRARQLAEQARVDAQLAESMARAAKAQRAADELQKSRRILQEEMVR